MAATTTPNAAVIIRKDMDTSTGIKMLVVMLVSVFMVTSSMVDVISFSVIGKIHEYNNYYYSSTIWTQAECGISLLQSFETCKTQAIKINDLFCEVCNKSLLYKIGISRNTPHNGNTLYMSMFTMYCLSSLFSL